MASMMENLEKTIEKVFPERFIKDTDEKLASTQIALSGAEYCGISLIVGIVVGVSIFISSLFVSFPYLPSPIYAVIGFGVSFLVLTLFLPYFYIERRVGNLEDALPDALRQMSTALRAGVGMDAALEDVAESDYGPLSVEFNRTIAQVRRGRSMRGALRAMAKRTRSELYERAFFLIVEGMEKGAELADVLEAVSDDIREIHTMQRERRSATIQQVLFLIVAALFAAPFITGLVLSLEDVFSEVGGGGMTGGAGIGGGGVAGALGGPILPKSTSFVIPAFIILESMITALAVGVIRYGRFSKGLLFAVPFVIVALLVFYASQFVTSFMI